MKKHIIIMTLWSLLLSCGKSGSSSSNQFTLSPIVGGDEIEDASYPGTVALLTPIRVRNKENNEGVGFPSCSGNVIGYDKVVTAAHCIIDLQNDDALVFRMRKLLALAIDKTLAKEDYIEEKFLKRKLNQLEIKKLKSTLKLNFENKAKNTLLYFGNGQLYQGFSFDFLHGEYLVKEVKINDEYLDYLFSELYKNADFFTKEMLVPFENQYDQVELILDQPVVLPKTSRLMTSEEYIEYIDEGTELYALGFGSKFDQAVIDYFANVLNKAKVEREELLQSSNMTPEKLKKLEDRIIALSSFVTKNGKLAEQYGSKAIVKLKVETIFEFYLNINSEVIDDMLHGVCNGDSGGPVFFKIPKTGELVQIGVISTGGYCGYGSSISLTLD